MDRAIWDAFRSREFAPIEALLAHGADAGYVRTEGGGETALMAAAYHGRRGDLPSIIAGRGPAQAGQAGPRRRGARPRQGQRDARALLDGVCLEPVAAPPRAATPPPPEAPATAKSPKQRGDDVHPRLLKKNGMDDDDDAADDEEAICSRSVALPKRRVGNSVALACQFSTEPQEHSLCRLAQRRYRLPCRAGACFFRADPRIPCAPSARRAW